MRMILIVFAAAALWAQSAGYRVRGTLLGDGNQPQGGAKVGIALSHEGKGGPQRFTLTDAQGVFDFAGLPAGHYRLFAQAKGYLQEDLNQHEGYFSAAVVGPGKDSEHIVFPLRRAAAIEGTVVDESGEAVRGASVALFRRTRANGELNTRLREEAQSDDRGVYAFHDLPPGEYFIAVTARPWYATMQMSCPGRLPAGGTVDKMETETAPPPRSAQTEALDVAYPLTFFGGAVRDREAQAIRLGTGERFHAEVVLRAVPAAHLRVYTAGPVRGQSVNVLLRETAFDSPMAVMTSAGGCGDGIWVVNGVAPGHYDATITTVVFPPQGGKVSERGKAEMPLDVDGDMNIDPQAQGVRNATVSGVVQLRGKLPARGDRARIYFGNKGLQTVSGELDDKGAFKPVAILPGNYEVMVYAMGAAPESRLYVVEGIAASGGGSAVGHTLVVNGGAVNVAVSASNQLGNITGTVMDGAKPVSGAMVLLIPKLEMQKEKALIRRDQTDSDGSFSLRAVPFGEYTVLALRHGWEMEWANPEVLKPFLPRGVAVAVDGSGKSGLTVPLQ